MIIDIETIRKQREERLEKEKKQREARTLLRMLKQNRTPISKSSAKALFEDAGWSYNPDAPYLELPE